MEPPADNEPCWCGSGKKYCRCHQVLDRLTEGMYVGKQVTRVVDGAGTPILIVSGPHLHIEVGKPTAEAIEADAPLAAYPVPTAESLGLTLEELAECRAAPNFEMAVEKLQWEHGADSVKDKLLAAFDIETQPLNFGEFCKQELGLTEQQVQEYQAVGLLNLDYRELLEHPRLTDTQVKEQNQAVYDKLKPIPVRATLMAERLTAAPMEEHAPQEKASEEPSRWMSALQALEDERSKG